MIEAVSQDIFHLRTRSSSYILHILESGQAEHVYYGHALRDAEKSSSAICEKHYVSPGFEAAFSKDMPGLALEDTLLEFSSEGLGDCKIPFVALSEGPGGERSADFRFQEARKYTSQVPMVSGLPQSKDRKGEAETLELVFLEDRLSLELRLFYTLFPSLDAITRRSLIVNRGAKSICLRGLASSQLDFRSSTLRLISFSGAWGREFERVERDINVPGTLLSESRKLISSMEANPGFFLEDSHGGAYACNLLYSGAHRLTCSLSNQGLTHVVWGVNPDLFSWPLESGESFESPEAVMIWAEDREEASEKMRQFVSSAILRSAWQGRLTPLMLGTWEALRYDPDENKVLDMARKARDLGMEGLILDDGWFGARENESTSLGDWTANTLKFPSGLYETAQDIHKLGLLFGLWFAPESVNVQSTLYKTHPQWCLGETGSIGGKGLTVLDFTQEEVIDWVVETLSETLGRCSVDYLRWDLAGLGADMRPNSPQKDRGMFTHKYVLGVYKALDMLGKRFPDLYIETSTAGGGGRFDLGMLCCSASIALSRNTDPVETVRMFSNASMLYPPSSIGTAVSLQPSSFSKRRASLETCFNVASFGALSYSLDLTAMSRAELRMLKEQVDFYKEHRLTFQAGLFSLEEEGERTVWTAARHDGSLLLALYFQKLAVPDTTAEHLRLPSADPSSDYLVYPRAHLFDLRHAKQILQESGSFKIPGDALCWAGISLPEQISGNGYTAGMRILGDFSSRLYVIRRIENE